MATGDANPRSILGVLCSCEGDAAAGVREDALFRDIRLPNGTAKETCQGRLDPLSTWWADHLGEVDGPLRLLDVGISSGVTTHEWLAWFRRRGHEVTGVGVDMYIHAILLRSGDVEFLTTLDGRLLCTTILGRRFSAAWGFDPLSLAKRALPVSVARAASRLLHACFAGGRVAPPGRLDPCRMGARLGFEAWYVPLLARSTRTDRDLTCREASLFDLSSVPGEFDLVRAANILNNSYFTTAELQEGFAEITTKVRDGGQFCVSRTDESGRTSATVWRRCGDKLEVTGRMNGGSEIEPSVASREWSRAHVQTLSRTGE